MTRYRTPLWVIIPGAVAIAFLAVPVVTVVLRAPWGDIMQVLTSPDVVETLRLSLVCSLSATVLSLILGVPLAWALARSRLPGRRLVRGLVLLPVVLPPVIGGLALITAFGRSGVVGRWLYETFDLTLPFSTAGTIVAETFVAMPFLILAVEGALRSSGTGLEDAAGTLGAGTWRVFTKVTLPSIAPAIAAGALLAWARALGEFGATITFAGNLPGATRTLPLAAFFALQRNVEAAIALSLILIIVSLGVIVGMRDRWMVAG